MPNFLIIKNNKAFGLGRQGILPGFSANFKAVAISGKINAGSIGNRQRTTIKILVYENKGFSILYRRLDEGSFQLPLIVSDHISYQMTVDQMTHMLSGLTLVDGGYLSKEKYEPLHGGL